jgi:hypothetical protein
VLGFAILSIYALLELFGAVGFLLGQPLGRATGVASSCASLALTWGAGRARIGGRPALLLGAAAILLTLFVAPRVTGWFYDLSWDGRAYHQEAVLRLAEGWNPVRAPSGSGMGADLSVEHYPKGAWTSAAAILVRTGRIERAKCFGLLLMLGSACLSLHALLEWRVPTRVAWALALLAALNPVAVCQGLTFCVDGQMASLLTILIALASLAVRRSHSWVEVGIALAVMGAAGLKFTGGPYAAVLLSGAWLVSSWFRRRPGPRILFVLLVGVALGTLVVGFNPYVTNLRDHSHPFYPLRGPGAVDVVTDAMPSNLRPMNRLGRLATSLISESDNEPSPFVTTRKRPFTIKRSELAAFDIADARIAGFGPLFSGILLLALLALGESAWRAPRAAFGTVLAVAVVLASAAINEHAWWARYAPQLWLVPLLVAVGATRLARRPRTWLAGPLVVAIALDASLVAGRQLLSQIEGTRSVRREFRAVHAAARPVEARCDFPIARVAFAESGIPVRLVTDGARLGCRDPQALERLGCRVCRPDVDERH